MKTETIEIKRIDVKQVTVKIVGDGDLILNKMNDVSTRQLTDQRKNKAKDLEVPNEWEQIITAMHWRDGKPTDFSEKGLIDALKNNAPCITAFGLKKSFGDAVVRNEDSYKELLMQAKAELRAFKNKYKMLTELEDIFNLID